MRSIFILLLAASFSQKSMAQPVVDYGFPVNYISIDIEGKSCRMAYMDIPAANEDAEAVLLLHGKNFNGFYWQGAISFLHNAGYRVIVPDQIGWGKSDRPNIHYSFHLLAANTKKLLDSLKIAKVKVIAHSMGGMLGTRFSLMYPESVSQLVLENPIGLEDYKTFVPYQPTDSLYNKELKATYQSYLQYQKSYYPVWKPEYEPLVAAQAADLQRPDFKDVAFANALTYQMIFEQPVCYEFVNLKVPVLLIIGQADRTIVGKDRLSASVKASHGLYPILGELTRQKIKGSRLVRLAGVGHIPHIQSPEAFQKEVLQFFTK